MNQTLRSAPASDYPFEGHYIDVENSATAGNQEVAAPRLRLHYIDAGPATGRPLVFLHGNPTWSYLSRNLVIPCAEAGYRALALDNMGYGLSDKPNDIAAHTARRHADNTRAFIDTLGLREAVIVGHAWGAFFALSYAAARPDNVAALILLNGDTFATIRQPLIFKLLVAPGFGELIARRFNLLARLLLYFGTKHRANLTPDVMAQYRRPFPDYRSRAAVLGLPRMIPGGPDHPTYPLAQALEARLSSLSMPTLLIAGAADQLIGEPATRRMQAQLPHAEAQVLAEAGHYLQEDAPVEVTQAILSFLRRHNL